MTTTTPAGALIVTPAKDGGGFYWEATWRHTSRSMKQRGIPALGARGIGLDGR
jgi:hypothetical protein